MRFVYPGTGGGGSATLVMASGASLLVARDFGVGEAQRVSSEL